MVHCGRIGNNWHKLDTIWQTSINSRNDFFLTQWVHAKAGKHCLKALRNLSLWVETQSLEKVSKIYWNVLSKLHWISGDFSGGWMRGLPVFLSRIPCQSNGLSPCSTKGLCSDKCKIFSSTTIFTAKRKITKLLFVCKQDLVLYQYFPSSKMHWMLY